MAGRKRPDAVVCLLTVHGIGFQQPPDDPARPGYADELHTSLSRAMRGALGDDPVRTARDPAIRGPVYVASEWPPRSGDAEAGLDRIARAMPGGRLEWDDRPLAGPGAKVAHVALVYAGLESTRPHLLVGLRALLSTLVNVYRYSSPIALLRQLRTDLGAVQPFTDNAPVAARVRGDIPHHRALPRVRRRAPARGSPGDTLVQLEDDVASYVYNKVLRRRVTAFVGEAVRRLLARDDVAAVVVNAHSQGTVVCCDVLSSMEPEQLRWIGALVTAGSPLRKYVDFFSHRRDVAALGDVPWVNLWDRLDPVADPLAPPPSWRPGADARLPAGELGLFTVHRTGGFVGPARIADRVVDNVANSRGGGLQAHSYWENTKEVVPALARLLLELAHA